jgi:hypothetical protein
VTDSYVMPDDEQLTERLIRMLYGITLTGCSLPRTSPATWPVIAVLELQVDANGQIVISLYQSSNLYHLGPQFHHWFIRQRGLQCDRLHRSPRPGSRRGVVHHHEHTSTPIPDW